MVGMSALAWPVWRIVAVFVLTASAPSIQNACRDTGSDAEPDRDDRVVTASDGTRVRVEVVATGLEVPWSLAFVPDGRLLVTERPGRVRVLANGRLVPEPALALDDVYANAEAGTMGIAVDPRFEENGLVYLLYTRDSPGRGPVNRVVRYREVGNVLAEATVLLDEIPASFRHDGGRIRFGPDGLLYVTMGDVLEADDRAPPLQAGRVHPKLHDPARDRREQPGPGPEAKLREVGERVDDDLATPPVRPGNAPDDDHPLPRGGRGSAGRRARGHGSGRSSTKSTVTRGPASPAATWASVRTAAAVRPCRPISLPRSPGALRSSMRTVPACSRSRTRTASG